MASSFTLVRVVAVVGCTLTLLLQGCSSLKLGGYAGENYQIDPPYYPDMPVNTGGYNYHVVQRGENLSSIAQRYGKDWRELASLNNLRTPYTLEVGQRLLVASGVTAYPIDDQGAAIVTTPEKPFRSQSTPSPVRSAGSYTVRPGDTVYSLARRAGYSVSQLMNWNGLTTSQSLRVGQRFWLSPPEAGVATTSPYTMQRVAAPPAVSPSAPPPSSSNSHVVVGGDTLYNVARRYGNTQEQIVAWNGLSPPYRLTLGSVLRVGGKSQPMRSLNYPAPTKYSAPTKSSGSRYHTVSRGQTVYSIARMYGCSEYELLVNNKLSKPILRDKQKLDVSNCANRRSDAAPYNTSLVAQSLPAGVSGNLGFHTVRSGETLEDIAKLYGITSHELALSNGIGSPYTLFPGHRLKITSR